MKEPRKTDSIKLDQVCRICSTFTRSISSYFFVFRYSENPTIKRLIINLWRRNRFSSSKRLKRWKLTSNVSTSNISTSNARSKINYEKLLSNWPYPVKGLCCLKLHYFQNNFFNVNEKSKFSKNICTVRESKPGHKNGKPAWYHYTNGA